LIEKVCYRYRERGGLVENDELALLIAALGSRRGGPGTRAHAARMLGESRDPRAIAPLLDTIEDTGDPYKVPVVTAALDALPLFGDALEPALQRILADPADFRRRYVPRLLVSACGGAAAPTLLSLLDDADDEVAMNAATGLGSLHDLSYTPPLRAIVADTARPPLLRGVAASAVGMSGGPDAYDTLAPLVGSGEQSLVAGAIDGLAELGDPRAIPLIQALVASNRLDERTTRGAKLALISMRSR